MGSSPAVNKLLTLPYRWRRLLLLLADTLAVVVAIWAAFALRLGDWWPAMLSQTLLLFPLAVAVSIPAFYSFGFYRSIVRYAGGPLLYSIAQGISFSLLLIIVIWVLLDSGRVVPRSAWIIYWLVLMALVGGGRLLLRDFLRNRLRIASNGIPVMIYGASAAGVQLATALQHSPEFLPIGFVDDNRDLQGSEILGLPVYKPSKLPRLVEKQRVMSILLAIRSLPSKRRRQILDYLSTLPVRVLELPALVDLANGTRRIYDLREVRVEDILGREPVELMLAQSHTRIAGRVFMVTGAGGSIGSELCRQLVDLRPRRLILVERSEYSLYAIEREMRSLLDLKQQACELIPILGSVEHGERLCNVMVQFGVQTVYHAAAFKHVPIVEQNPIEGVCNNIFGTLETARAALHAGVETFVLISTDKAVRPPNVMGATKRFAELILQGLAQGGPATRFCMVRFGNVLGSSGSVVPLFREQIRRGGPVTVTHSDVVRYFMTVAEAAQLVIQAGGMAHGGDVFLLNMGEPVRILDLARRMIHLAGLEVKDENNPEGDIEIQFTGLRPGEKLYEELLISADALPTAHPMIYRAREEALPWSVLQEYLERLRQAARRLDYIAVRSILLQVVKGYQPECPIQDWVFVEQIKSALMFSIGGDSPVVGFQPERTPVTTTDLDSDDAPVA